MLCVNVFSNIGELSFRIPPLFLKILVENERGNEIGFGWLGFCLFLLKYNEDASSDCWFDLWIECLKLLVKHALVLLAEYSSFVTLQTSICFSFLWLNRIHG